MAASRSSYRGDINILKIGIPRSAVIAELGEPDNFTTRVKMPVLMVQVLKDSWTRNPEDAQNTFDLLGSKEKELLWIENTTRRFKDGYNYFWRYPEKIIPFIDKHMK